MVRSFERTMLDVFTRGDFLLPFDHKPPHDGKQKQKDVQKRTDEVTGFKSLLCDIAEVRYDLNRFVETVTSFVTTQTIQA